MKDHYDLILLLLYLTITSFIDIKSKKIPNFLTLGGFVLFLALVIFKGWKQVLSYLLSAVIVFIFMGGISLLSKNKLGMGDAKLSLAVGGILGVYYWFISLFVASLSALAMIFSLLLLGKSKRNQPFPFAPFLSLGALAAFYLKEQGLFFF